MQERIRYWGIGVTLLFLSLAVTTASRAPSRDYPVGLAVEKRTLTAPLPGAKAIVLGEKISLNRASARDLMAVPGIGPSRAEEIVRWRVRRGGFRRVEDLRNVSGVGPRILDRVRPYLSL